ncbi:hypothetical protein H072_2639 [Dactylellina haptotyla CBS 200.50]|uniref:Erythromycin biosynthesis protein CIII-like C-terminal domain-containing protein n=1 Tax=Dactylellina haptotyla (strain CBS 200.50) TaxID=1284197 RepID=S8C6P9_DACHA|nr:hypothetical protein H072_2639 [Dactylellina haptotyla CBS 200.50]
MIRKAALIAAFAVGGALLYSQLVAEDDKFLFQQVQGKNNTVLFLTNDHPGFCYVHLASVYSLLANHPEIDIHYASFPKTNKRLQKIVDLAALKASSRKDVIFHPLDGLSYAEAIERAMGRQEVQRHGPGLAAARKLTSNFRHYLAPWPVEEYLMMYEAISGVIEKVDPAVIVIDTFFSPGIDATRDKRRLHALVTPNILSDLTPAAQPPWTLFWKYPALGSGFPYPVPWKHLRENIYVNFQIIRGMLSLPEITAKRKFLQDKGIKRPIDFMGIYRPDVPWITQTLPGAHLPMMTMPTNVTLTGPINLAGLEEMTPAVQELLNWIDRPTVLINLGSGYKYLEYEAMAMLGAILAVLKETDVQIIWKMDKLTPFDDEPMQTALREWPDRLRIEKWLAVEPPTLVQHEHVMAFVHHGGAGCFHDAIGGGVSQIILPLWADLYDIAQLAQFLGIGIWACQETSPSWNVECLQHALFQVIKDSPTKESMAKKAALFGELARKSKGRDVAAQEIAKLAASGYP